MSDRPYHLTEEVAEEIFRRLVEGDSLAAICRDETMPRYYRVFEWLREDEEFAKGYARAREAQGDTDADRIGDIADMVVKGEIAPDAARAAIDAYKWTAARRLPNKYGNNVSLNADGRGPVKSITVNFVGDEPDE